MKRGFSRDFASHGQGAVMRGIFAPRAVLSGDKSVMLRKTLAVIGYSGFSIKKTLTYPPLYFIVKDVLGKWKDFR